MMKRGGITSAYKQNAACVLFHNGENISGICTYHYFREALHAKTV